MECSEVIELIKVSTPTIITFLCTMIGGGFIWCLRHYLEVIRTKEKRLYQERRELYIDILEPYIRAFVSVKNPSEMKKAFQKIKSYEYRKISFEFNMIASDKVILSFNDYAKHLFKIGNNNSTNDDDTKKLFRLLGKVIRECRKDLGSKETKLKEKNMLEGWIVDIDNYL